MPDLAEQDDRRPLATPAHRAGLVPAPIGIGPRPLLLVVTGPSGVGKGTLIRALRERLPGLELSVSATTRPPRAGEVDGRDYYFLSPEQFEERVRRGEFLEHATYSGNRYGTLRSELDRVEPAALDSGEQRTPDGAAASPRGLVLEIELQGARQVRSAVPDSVQVFIEPPSVEALRARLVGRGSDSPEEIEERLAAARAELDARREFPHVVVNDRLERAVAELTELVSTIWSRQLEGAPE